ncbi:unnamed protein product [Thlaspi arvense]|uniref:Uncharacterized protein n=1 Tax=Thlaspi arvense TaxID=13288 RepID=A0AAU9SZU8_THLAR|nr:unnamed protein product [Thlaspi arvense]
MINDEVHCKPFITVATFCAGYLYADIKGGRIKDWQARETVDLFWAVYERKKTKYEAKAREVV